MLILISPAKTLEFASPAPSGRITEPDFLGHSAVLIERLRKLTPGKIGRLMDISPKLAALNFERYRNWEGTSDAPGAKQALYAFYGDVYEGLDAASLAPREVSFAQEHLRILSGLYGVLRPLDRIEAHRLEMGTKLAVARSKNLYAFWGARVTEALNAQLERRAIGTVVNLASEEYFKVVRAAELRVPVVTPVFEEFRAGRFQVISFFAKRARGLLARHAIARRVTDPRALHEFAEEGYRYCPEASTSTTWRFRRTLKGQE